MPAQMTMDAVVSEIERAEPMDQRQAPGAVAPRGNRNLAASVQRLLRVLVIDDDEETTDSLSRLVRFWGHDVRWAYDAGVGLKVAAAFHPDLLLIDIAMPLVDGCELSRQLRGDPRLNECFIIAVTGRCDAAHRQGCKEAGIDLVLVKPVDLVILESL